MNLKDRSMQDATDKPALMNKDLLDCENWDFSGEDTQYLLHNLHPYPAKFIPQIPRRAIERWTMVGDVVLDPFCGSGTTLLEAALSGRNSIGVDNNGVATLISKAKTFVYTEADLQLLLKVCDDIENESKKYPYPWEGISVTHRARPSYFNIEKWFDEKSIRELSWLRLQFQKLPEPAKTLGMSIFSSIIVQASRQYSDTRYVATNRPYVAGSATKKWTAKVLDAVSRTRATMDMRRFDTTHRIFTKDSRNLSFIDKGSVDLIVTSPPYINAYDYHKYHRHRLHWIDSSILLARDVEIGRHDVYSRPHSSPDSYFRDIGICLREWSRVLKPGGRLFIVVGDGIVDGRVVRAAYGIIRLSEKVGFSLESRWIRKIDPYSKSFNSSSRIVKEDILLFKKGI